MLLVVDVGNTNITFGVYRDKELVTTFRLMSKTPRTSDEYGVLITELLSKNHLAIDQIEGIAVASVVPNIMHSLIGGIKRYVNRTFSLSVRELRQVSALLLRIQRRLDQTESWMLLLPMSFMVDRFWCWILVQRLRMIW